MNSSVRSLIHHNRGTCITQCSCCNVTQPPTIEMQYNFVNNRWMAESETWRRWRSRTMEDVVRAETIHIQVHDIDRHFLVLDVYQTLLYNAMSHQESHLHGSVLLTGQPGPFS